MRSILCASVLICLIAGAGAARADGPSAQALDDHAAAVAKRLKGRGFTVLVEPPFVLIGDEDPATVRHRAKTVRWTRGLLMKDFFATELDRVLEIWLFKDKTTYRRGAKEFFGDTPDTPFGYYSAANNALVMNIGPGAGTLVHEIVHPYLETNFPEVPSWFDEGLASLYERPTEVNGHIQGVPNWRLPYLQKEIRAHTGRTLASLVATTRDEFYDAEDQTYARARYLCYYLQEKGVLVDFYKRWKKDHVADPTGARALTAVLGVKDLADFEADFAKFVLALRSD